MQKCEPHLAQAVWTSSGFPQSHTDAAASRVKGGRPGVLGGSHPNTLPSSSPTIRPGPFIMGFPTPFDWPSPFLLIRPLSRSQTIRLVQQTIRLSIPVSFCGTIPFLFRLVLEPLSRYRQRPRPWIATWGRRNGSWDGTGSHWGMVIEWR